MSHTHTFEWWWKKCLLYDSGFPVCNRPQKSTGVNSFFVVVVACTEFDEDTVDMLVMHLTKKRFWHASVAEFQRHVIIFLLALASELACYVKILCSIRMLKRTNQFNVTTSFSVAEKHNESWCEMVFKRLAILERFSLIQASQREGYIVNRASTIMFLYFVDMF